jgi:metal transporter CNNM
MTNSSSVNPNNEDTGLLVQNIIITVICLVFSALFSGLTLGVMGLDQLTLEAIIKSKEKIESDMTENNSNRNNNNDNNNNQIPENSSESNIIEIGTYAKNIFDLRLLGNHLLCTLLLGNTVVNVLISQTLPEIIGEGIMAVIVATALITVLAEIIPQAVCSSSPLYIGSKTRYITWMMVYIFYIVAKPISAILDCVIGKEIGQVYVKQTLLAYLEVHTKHTESGVTAIDIPLVENVIDFSERKVSDVIKKLENEDLYMLDVDTILDLDKINEITEMGFSRIPVYKNSRKNILGIFYTDDFSNILIQKLENPDYVWPPIGAVSRFRDNIHQITIFESKPLKSALDLMRHGGSHMLIAIGENKKYGLEMKGIFTMEDVIEVLTDDIKDERDNDDERSEEQN